jgi:hypothetical protein
MHKRPLAETVRSSPDARDYRDSMTVPASVKDM